MASSHVSNLFTVYNVHELWKKEHPTEDFLDEMKLRVG